MTKTEEERERERDRMRDRERKRETGRQTYIKIERSSFKARSCVVSDLLNCYTRYCVIFLTF